MSSKNPITLLATSRYLFSTTTMMNKTTMGWAKYHHHRHYTTTTTTTTNTTGTKTNRRYKLVVVGAGSGGCAIAAKFANKAKRLDPSHIAIIEPSDTHYYQPFFTLVGGGIKTLQDSQKPMSKVIPQGVEWIKDKAVNIDPKSQTVRVGSGKEVEYDYLIVATGIQLHYNQIKGLVEALNTKGVCSNYSPLYVNKTFAAIKSFNRGNAVFTFPNTPIKCAGAPQKILYLTDSFLRKNKKRQDAQLIYCTSLGNIFGVKHYADALWKIANKRDITVNLRHNLVEVLPKERKAVFENLDKPSETKIIPYEMLHVTPPMGPQDFMKDTGLCDPAGYLDVDKETLRHVKYSNIFGLGDCTNLPTSKTGAAVAAQTGVLFENLWSIMNNKEMVGKKYDGYTSCPLVTSYKHCMLAEFDYNLQPLETFPFNQAKESRLMFILKRDILPAVYWNLHLTGYWNGPAAMRRRLHLGFSK